MSNILAPANTSYQSISGEGLLAPAAPPRVGEIVEKLSRVWIGAYAAAASCKGYSAYTSTCLPRPGMAVQLQHVSASGYPQILLPATNSVGIEWGIVCTDLYAQSQVDASITTGLVWVQIQGPALGWIYNASGNITAGESLKMINTYNYLSSNDAAGTYTNDALACAIVDESVTASYTAQAYTATASTVVPTTAPVAALWKIRIRNGRFTC